MGMQVWHQMLNHPLDVRLLSLYQKAFVHILQLHMIPNDEYTKYTMVNTIQQKQHATLTNLVFKFADHSNGVLCVWIINMPSIMGISFLDKTFFYLYLHLFIEKVSL